MNLVTRATHYEVSALPEDLDDALLWAIHVVYKGNDLWAVERLNRCLGADGLWDHRKEPRTGTAADDEWLTSHRFPLTTALRLAQDAASTVTVNGKTAADVLSETEVPRG